MTQTNPHTPGPWKARCPEFQGWAVYADGKNIATLLAREYGHSDLGATGAPLYDEKAAANARLIAAAPDLLAALKWFDNRAFKGMSQESAALTAWAFVDAARAAIALAEGGAKPYVSKLQAEIDRLAVASPEFKAGYEAEKQNPTIK